MMHDVYTQVREHLCVAAQRRKKAYDIRTRPAEFKEGDRVYYFYPRRYTKRSPKWQRMYTGPYTVTRILPPANVVIQRSRRSRPFVVHVDKLKLATGMAEDHSMERRE